MSKDTPFCHLQEDLKDKYGKKKKKIDIATKIGTDAAKNASKRVVQKTAETTGGLIRNEIVVKITSAGRTKSKKKKRNLYTT